jgi:hypothetical protein
MAAWGPKPFQNELATDFVLTLVNTNIHNILLEPIDRDTKFLKHKLSYYYDRFRAALELMILFEENKVFAFAKGYYDLAIEKLNIILTDIEYHETWDNKSKTKSQNYILDIQRQLQKLMELQNLARD